MGRIEMCVRYDGLLYAQMGRYPKTELCLAGQGPRLKVRGEWLGKGGIYTGPDLQDDTRF